MASSIDRALPCDRLSYTTGSHPPHRQRGEEVAEKQQAARENMDRKNKMDTCHIAY